MNGRVKRLFGVLFVVGVILICTGATDTARGHKTPVDFAVLKAEEVKKNLIVEGDLYVNLGPFAENYTTRNGVKTGNSRYTYLIPVGDAEYMGFLNNTVDMQDQLDTQTADSFDYMSGGGMPSAVHFKGRVIGMDSETKGYMHDYMADMGFTEDEIAKTALSYYIQCEDYSSGPTMLIIGLILAFISAAVVLVPIISAYRQPKAQNVVGAGNPQNSAANDTLPVFENGDVDSQESNSDTRSPFDFPEMDAENQKQMDTSGLGEGILDDSTTSSNG